MENEMQQLTRFIALLGGLTVAATLDARPYPGVSGLAAAADSAVTAGSNPAGMARLKTRTMQGRIIGLFSDTIWASEFENVGITRKSDDSNTTIVPTGYLVQPINEDWVFGFTILGSGFSDDLGDWPGRYFIEDYDLIYVSAFPSLAHRVNDQLSLAASAVLTYSRYKQSRAVRNSLDPGFGDGSMKLDTDGYTAGFGLSALYEFTARTRVGLTYQSKLDPELDGKAKFRNLGPNTEAALSTAGLLNARIDTKSRSPQSVLAGVYHEFENNHAVTFDLIWSDFSNFKLSEIYVDGNSIADNDASYQDIWTVSASYTWPVNERLMLGVSGLYVDDMIKNDERTMMLRLDSLWSIGVGLEWLWKKERKLSASVSYIGVGDAPTTTPRLPGLGTLSGKYTKRDTLLVEIAMSLGSP